MAEGDTPTGNASYNTATVGIARVGRVEVLDQKTGQPRDGNNDLVDQIKVLGSQLDTSLGAILAQMKELTKTTYRATTDADQHQDKVEGADKAQIDLQKKLIDVEEKQTKGNELLLRAINTFAKSGAKAGDDPAVKELVDVAYQFNSGAKGMTAGLRGFTAAHKTIMREFQQNIRDNAHKQLDQIDKIFKSKSDEHRAAFIDKKYATYHGPPTPQDMKHYQPSMFGHASLTYGKQKIVESGHATLESMAGGLDKAVGSLFSFSTAIDYAAKKWKEFADVAGSGTASFSEYMFTDAAKLWKAGDSLTNTFDLIRKSAKEGFDGQDSQLMIAGRSLQEASEKIRNMRVGVQQAGFNTNAFMNTNDANEVLLQMLTQMKRGGILDQMSDDQRNHYMAEQLKQAQMTAENTGLTVKEVIKMGAEAAKKIAVLNAGGMIADAARPMWDAFQKNFSQTNPELMNKALEIKGSGGIEQWASKNKPQASAMIADGTFEMMRRLIDTLDNGRGNIDEAMKGIRDDALQTGQFTHQKLQAQGANVSGAVTSPNAMLQAELNRTVDERRKNAAGQGDGVMSGFNTTKDVMENYLPAIPAILGTIFGSLGTANALLGVIAWNTGLGGAFGGLLSKIPGVGKLAGKLFGGSAGALVEGAVPAAAGLAEGAPAVAAASGIAGSTMLGTAAKVGGKFLLKGLPIVGGLAGGAIDKASGGSLLSAILSGGASGAVMGGIAGAPAFGAGAIPGAIIGGIGGAVTGAIGYGLAGAAGVGNSPDGSPVAQVAPDPASYAAGGPDALGLLGKGMMERMDTQIEKLVELIDVIKDSNKQQAMQANIARQTANLSGGDVGDGGSFLGTIKKMWG